MTSPTSLIRIATRSSRLALWQAEHVASLLRGLNAGWNVELVPLSTQGDVDLSSPLHQMGGEGVFTKEVQAAVLSGRADVAVHSMKDLPTAPTAGLVVAGVPARGPMHDAVVFPRHSSHRSLDELPHGARLGTGSLRRQAQVLHHRPDLTLLGVRGNVETRLKKLDAGEYDALLLAVAGLDRLALVDRPRSELSPPLMYPAVGQGALGLECPMDDARVSEALAAISDAKTMAAVTAERSLLASLRAGCHAPVGVSTRSLEHLGAGSLHLEAVVLSSDGRTRLMAAASGNEADALGRTVADLLRTQGADRLIQAK